MCYFMHNYLPISLTRLTIIALTGLWYMLSQYQVTVYTDHMQGNDPCRQFNEMKQMPNLLYPFLKPPLPLQPLLVLQWWKNPVISLSDLLHPVSNNPGLFHNSKVLYFICATVITKMLVRCVTVIICQSFLPFIRKLCCIYTHWVTKRTGCIHGSITNDCIKISVTFNLNAQRISKKFESHFYY